MNKPIFVTRSSMPDFQEFIDEIEDIWESHHLTNRGPKHQQLEKRLKEYMGVPNVSLFTNGHLALECAIESLNLTGEVITSPFTFASTIHSIVRKGLKPVFCDIRPDNYTIDVQKLENLVTENTSAIIPIHVYGNICDVEGIDSKAKKYNLKVLYDAAHAFGIKVNGVPVGNFGDASMFSFHATKVFHTIEGGAVACSDSNLKRRMDTITNFGIIDQQTIRFIAGNAKMNEFQAAMGICNLRHLDEQIRLRREIANRYRRNLNGLIGVDLRQEQSDVTSNYAYFPVLFHESICGKNRNEIHEGLAKEQIYSRKYFYPLVSDLQCYIEKYGSVEIPVAKYVSESVLCLPLYADLTFSQVDEICKAIIDALK